VNFSTALREIESHDFAARLGVANTTNMLFTLAQQEQSVKDLLSALEKRDEANRLLAHAVSILREQEDVRYRNSRDTAVAVYIWALKHTHPLLAKLLAAEVLGAPRLWWARRIAIETAEGIFHHPNIQSTAGVFIKTATTSQWKTGSTQTKDVLIVSEPGTDLIRRGNIIDPDDIEATSDATKSQEDTRDFRTDGESQIQALRAETVRK
jgi:hypothetical protein